MATNLTARGARANTAARLPALPAAQQVTDPVARNLFELIREWLEVRLGARGDFYERAVTHRELREQLDLVDTDDAETARLRAQLAQLRNQFQAITGQLALVQSLVNQTFNNPNTEIQNIYNQIRGVAVEDVIVFARDMLPSTTGGCSALTVIEFDPDQPNFHALMFDPTTQESADFNVMLPFGWAGKMFKVYVYWGHGGSGTTWAVRWEIQANSAGDNETVILDFIPGVSVDDTGGTPGNLYIGELTDPVPISSNYNHTGDLVSLRISRRCGDTEDTMNIDAALLAVRFTLADVPFPVPATCVAISGEVLLHCTFEGTTGDTTWPDLSPYLRTLTGGATLKLSNTRSKWGTSSLKWTARNCTAAVVSGSEFGLAADEPFTVALWGWHTTTLNFVTAVHFFRWTVTGSISEDLWNYANTAKVQYNNETFGSEMTETAYTTGQWTHFELGFNGTNIYVFADGALLATIARGRPTATYTGTFYLGGDAASTATADGTEYYMGEIIVVKGECLHTAAFTPPTVPYCTYESADPYYADTILILNCEQANGSTTFIDTSPIDHVVSASGGTSITDEFAVFDGTNDLLRLTDATAWDFGTGDFTIEVVANLDTLPALWGLITNRSPGVSDPDEGFQLVGTSAGLIQATVWGEPSGGAVVLLNLQSASGTATTGLHHFCLQRSVSNFVLAYDGASVASGTSSAAMGYNSGFDVQIGNDESATGRFFDGKMRVRVTKGVARYTFPFTPSYDPWPDPT